MKPLRTIKSFVRRRGKIAPSKKHALTEFFPTYGLTTHSGMLNLSQLLPNKKEVMVEIGFGMGDTLIEIARQYPDTGFIGIEVHTAGVANTLFNIKENQLDNIHVFHEDAIEVLNKSIPDHSIDKILLFFPDPWHKKRHHKRRIVQPAFLDLMSKKLKPNGIFHAATDWEDYAIHMLTTLEKHNAFKNQFDSYAPRPEWRPLTKFEKRGQRLGHGVWDLVFSKQ